MPVPKTKSVSKLMHFFKNDKPGWSHERVVAAALNTARRNGANIPKPKSNRR